MRFDFDTFEFIELTEHPRLAAIHDADSTMSWQALRTAVDVWMMMATEAGARADQPLVITGHKESDFVVAMLGCLRLGVPFVPIDVINPAERVRRITELVHAHLVYDTQKHRFTTTEHAGTELEQKGVAYIMFTSGSTGDPKGVQIGRESIGLFAGWVRKCLQLGSAPVFMDQMLFSFDFSLFNWVGALTCGGTVALCARETIEDGSAFMDYLVKTRVSVWASTPSFLRQQMLSADFNAQQLPDLKTFVLGAESLTPTMAEALWERFPGIRLINSYGPTEATCSTTWVEVDPVLRKAAPLPFPIGRAKPYADVFIEDGEICIAGDHVMRGYLNRPDLNETRMFMRNGKRGYRSGDIGDMDLQGLVTFRGRRDDQIKLHGYRIELAEVDAALALLPGVRAGAAIALKRPDGVIVRMIGFVDPDHAGPEGLHAPSELLQDWKAILARRVPSYMVPSELLICHGFPMSQTDKADRKKLEQMYRESRTSAATKPGAQPAQRTGQPA
ncbi:D-alanine--poly(phosphoribitol) ligase [Diaphorobacter sp. HDW4A]|uniref:AMP-binding protein n=1 Tax=Diaphorobacter sp. HDW4A TaxID=2714924 RepID=UPI00140E21F4|nr:AMP-binding protein [Diaphorobacter sp. HDW4A]QIL82148.1 D-alanine--poly(phosphoribitol) ligase [Diaphorobacter sp. HDW4A]